MGVQGYNKLGKASGEAAQKGKCIDLRKLSLYCCEIIAKEITALSPALPLVEEVDLSDNKQMGVQGYTGLGKAIIKASGEAARKGKCIDLQKLILDTCEKTIDELTALSPARPSVKEACSSYNKEMGVQGYTELGNNCEITVDELIDQLK